MKNTQPTSTMPVSSKFLSSLAENDAVSRARLLKALADPTRLRMLNLLSRYGGRICVSELGESFAITQPTVSHHLRILRDAGLVGFRKRGLWVYYSVRPEALHSAQEIIRALEATPLTIA